MGEKLIVYSDKSAPKICLKTPTECVKPTKYFIVHKLSGWFYHTDGKRCAFCLTCGKKSERFYKNRNFWNNIEPLLRVDLNLLETKQKTIQ